MKGKKKAKKKICPICHKEGSGIYKRWVMDKTKTKYEPYYYFAHKVKDEKGNWKNKWCYIPKRIISKIKKSKIKGV